MGKNVERKVSYLLLGINPKFWQKVKFAAVSKDTTIKGLILNGLKNAVYEYEEENERVRKQLSEII